MVRLSPDQEAAERKVCQWLFETKSPFFALGGLAGTGKSTLAGVLASRFRESGVLTAFAAPFGKAASILRSKGMPAHTLCSLLYRVAGTYMDDNGNECPAFVDKPWSEPEQAQPRPQRHGREHGTRGYGDQRPGRLPVDAGAHQAVEQQGWEEYEIDQLLDPVPEVIAQMHHAAQRRTEQDQRKIGQKQEGSRHGRAIMPLLIGRTATPGRR